MSMCLRIPGPSCSDVKCLAVDGERRGQAKTSVIFHEGGGRYLDTFLFSAADIPLGRCRNIRPGCSYTRTGTCSWRRRTRRCLDTHQNNTTQPSMRKPIYWTDALTLSKELNCAAYGWSYWTELDQHWTDLIWIMTLFVFLELLYRIWICKSILFLFCLLLSCCETISIVWSAMRITWVDSSIMTFV